MRSLKSNINLVMIGAGGLGFVLIIILFFFEDIFGGSALLLEDGQKQFFNQHPAYLIWFTFMALQGALWCILLFPATAIILRIRRETGNKFKLIIAFLFLLIILLLITTAGRMLIFPYLVVPDTYINHQDIKLQTFASLARGVGLYFLAGIVLIGRKCLKNIEMKDFDITDYKKLRSYQDALLNFTALVLSLGVITSILFHNAWRSQNPENTSDFPLEFVISFGLLNTLVMAIFYLPNYFIMHQYGTRILESKFPLENEGKEIIPANFKNQNILSKKLQIDLTFTESIKKTLLILSPLFSSLLPDFFELF